MFPHYFLKIPMIFSVSIATKPEDSGLWGCRVWKGGDVIKNSTAIVNLQVDGKSTL